MAYETSAERAKAIADADKAAINFVARTRTIVHEAGVFLNALTAAKTELESAKAVSDLAVAASPNSAVLASENALIAAKIAEQSALITQGAALKTALEGLV